MLLRKFVSSAILLSVCGFLTGCGTLKPAPFKTYAQTVNTAQTALDKALSIHYDWVRSGFIENFQGKFSDLIIKPGKGYHWTMAKMPLYLTIKKTRASLLALNHSYAEYTALLVRLSELQVGKPEEFNKMTRALNRNAGAALKVTQSDLSEENTAIISMAALEAARVYLRSKHLADMEKVIKNNQIQVEAYSMHCIALVHTLRSTLKTYYVEKYGPLKRRWKTLTKEKERLKLVEEMTVLNEGFADTMRLLQEIEVLYQHLPKAHADLAKPVDDAKWHANRQGLHRLIESGKRLSHLYNEIKPKENK